MPRPLSAVVSLYVPVCLMSVLVACAFGACRSVQPANAYDSVRTDPDTSVSSPIGDQDISVTDTGDIKDHWPKRWGSQPDTRGVVVDLEHPVGSLGVAHLSRNHQLRISDIEYADIDALSAALGVTRPPKFRAEGPGSYVFAPRDIDDDDIDADQEPELAFRFVSAQLVKRASLGAGDSEDHVELERTWFTFNTPLRESDQPRLLVLLPGMFGTPEPIVDATERYFRMKGWSVLRMLAHPSRFTTYKRFGIPTEPVAASLIGAAIALEYDNRTAECAYAVDAAIERVLDHDPMLRGVPTTMLGMSGGAMVAPTTHSYAPDRFDSVVLIAGGANFLEITARSNYSKWIDAVELDADTSTPEIEPLGKIRLAELSDVYVEYTKLDALKTSTSLRDKPVLMLHASGDKAVPASSGDALHEALGAPERWTFPVGHELIFAALPIQIPKIEQWARDNSGR